MAKQRTIEQLERKLLRLKPTKEKADLLTELGERIYFSDITRARSLFEQALSLAESLKHRPAQAKAHEKLASFYGRSDLWQESLKHAELARDLYQRLNLSAGQAIATRLMGEAHITSGDYGQSRDLLAEALRMQKKMGDDEGEGYTHGALGILHWKQGSYPESRQEFESALGLFRKLGNEVQSIYATNNLAVLESEQGNYARSLSMLLDTIPVRKRLGDVSGLIEAYGNIGTQYAMFADYEKALEYMLRGLELREQNNAGRGDVAMSNIAYVYSKLGKPDQAERYYRQALTIAEERQDDAEASDYHSNLSAVLSKQNRFDDALAHANRAIELAEGLGNAGRAAGGYANLAAIHFQRQEYAEALPRIQRAVEIVRGIGNEQHLEEHLRALAGILTKLGRTDLALEAALESLDLATGSDRKASLSEVLAMLSELYEERGDSVRALEMYKRHHSAYSGTLDQNAAHKLQTLTVQFDVEQLRREAEISALKAERFELELEMKRKELSIAALHLAKKNEFLNDLKEQISADTRNTDEFLNQLARYIQSGIESDQEWEEFENRFTQTNPEFTTRLVELSQGKLSPMEIRICSLIRTGLSTKEIANVLFVSARTVESHRYHIQKKLGLGSQKLQAHLMGI